MKKTILKSAPGAVAAAASSFDVWKAYDAYGNKDKAILLENIEALSEDGNTENQPEMIRVRNKSGRCWERHINERHMEGHLAYEVSYTESDRWYSCILIPMQQYIEQNKVRKPAWTKCQNGDTGHCKVNEVQQEEKPETQIHIMY